MKVLVFVADGSEETETVAAIDIFRRAGWHTTLVSINEITVTCSRGVKILADKIWNEASYNEYDMIYIPGGAKGVASLSNHEGVLSAIKDFARSEKILAAICAGPLVLQAAKILEGRKITCHPSISNQIKNAEVLDKPVVKDSNVITSRGPGTTLDLALFLIETVDGPELRKNISKDIVYFQNE